MKEPDMAPRPDLPLSIRLLTEVTEALDNAERALTMTTARGTWKSGGPGAGGRGGSIRHSTTGDLLGTFTYRADAEHAVTWQPNRVRDLIAAERAELAMIALMRDPNSHIYDSWAAAGHLYRMAVRWGLAPDRFAVTDMTVTDAPAPDTDDAA
jgi:hypothetical protein